MEMGPVKFEDLVCMGDSQAVFAEAERILTLMDCGFDLRPLKKAFGDVLDLFAGKTTGYRRCNIKYHDLKHTTDCFLAMARLIHGAHCTGIAFNGWDVTLGLIAALLHDTGYIQRTEDLSGTGAKYTIVHIERSIGYLRDYFEANGFSEEDFRKCHNFLRCTGLDVRPEDLRFTSPEEELLGKMLGAADILGQMADRTYLERLPFLYSEFHEAEVPGFESELDLLRKTPGFWGFIKGRLKNDLGDVDRFMHCHFLVRWGLDRDLYREAIERNIAYLQYILQYHAEDYIPYLRRGGLMLTLVPSRSRDGASPPPCKTG